MNIRASIIIIKPQSGKCPAIEKRYKKYGLKPLYRCQEVKGGRVYRCKFFAGLTKGGIIKCQLTNKHPVNP